MPDDRAILISKRDGDDVGATIRVAADTAEQARVKQLLHLRAIEQSKHVASIGLCRERCCEGAVKGNSQSGCEHAV